MNTTRQGDPLWVPILVALVFIVIAVLTIIYL